MADDLNKDKPPATAAGAQPPAGHAPAAPKPPAGPASKPWESEIVSQLQQRFGSGIKEASTYLGQNYIVADRSVAFGVLELLRDDFGFNYCVDVTAVHYPLSELQFEVIWILYSYDRNERVRIKASIAEGDTAPSAVSLWSTANWLEREVFDMFGIRFDGHPDMRRILLPEDWKGHPLRKDYGILQQDTEWVQINLGIESGQ